MCFLAQPSHVIQHLDVGVFELSKKGYRKECDTFYSQSNSTSVFNIGVKNKYTYRRVFSAAFVKSITPTNTLKTFPYAGIWPINQDMVNWKKCQPAISLCEDDNVYQTMTPYSFTIYHVIVFVKHFNTLPTISFDATTSPSSIHISNKSFESELVLALNTLRGLIFVRQFFSKII